MLGRPGGKGRTGRTQADGRLSWPAGDGAAVLAGVVQPASVSSQKESQSRLARGRSVRSCKAPYMSPRCASREERSNEDRTAPLIATTTQPVRLIPTSCHRPIPPPKRNPHPRRCAPPNPHRGAPPRPNCLPRPTAPGTGQPRRPTSCRGPWPPQQSHPLPPPPQRWACPCFEYPKRGWHVGRLRSTDEQTFSPVLTTPYITTGQHPRPHK